MFKIIENYRQLFSLCVKNQFAGENPDFHEDIPVIKEETVNDLINSIKSDGKIDEKDLAILTHLEEKLNSEKDEVRDVTMNMLKKSYIETLTKGFEVKNEDGYTVLKMLLSKIDQNIKMPEYSTLRSDNNSFTISYEEGKIKVYKSIFAGGSTLVGIIENGEYNGKADSGDFSDKNFTSNDNNFGLNLDNKIKGKKEIKHEKTANDLVKEEQIKIDKQEEDEINKQEKEQAQKISKTLTEEEVKEPVQDNAQKSSKEDGKTVEKVDVEKQKLDDAIDFYKKAGSTPEKIKIIQNALIQKGEKLPLFKDDGSIGKELFDATVSFQKKNNLKLDGKAGNDTLKALGLINDKQTSKDFYNELIKTSLQPIEKVAEVVISSTDRKSETETTNVTYEDFIKDTNIKGVPVNKQADLARFYEQADLSTIDLSSFHTYEDLKNENTFLSRKSNSSPYTFDNMSKTDSYEVTIKPNGRINIDGGSFDLGGTEITDIPENVTFRDIAKIVSWYHNSGEETLNTHDISYNSIKNELYEL